MASIAMLNYQRIYLWENHIIDPGWPEVTIPESPGCPEVVGSFMIPIDEHFFQGCNTKPYTF